MAAVREVESVVPVAAEPPAPTVNFEQIIRERDDLIQHLQMEVDRIGYVVSVFFATNLFVTSIFHFKLANTYEVYRMNNEIIMPFSNNKSHPCIRS